MIDKVLYYFILLIVSIIPIVTLVGFVVNLTRYVTEALEKSFYNNYRNWKFVKKKGNWNDWSMYIPLDNEKYYWNEVIEYKKNITFFIFGLALSLIVSLILIAFFHFLGNSFNWLPAKNAMVTINDKLSYLFSISALNDLIYWYTNDFNIIFKIILYFTVLVFFVFILWYLYLLFFPSHDEIKNHNRNLIKKLYKREFEEYINYKDNYISLLSKGLTFHDSAYFVEDMLKSEIKNFKKYYLRYGDTTYKTEPFFDTIDSCLKSYYKHHDVIYEEPKVEKYYFENNIEEDYLLEKLVNAGKKHNLLK